MKRIVMSDYEVKSQPLWWHKRGLMYNAKGQGKKIPTPNMIKVDNRWYRIYAYVSGNWGYMYIQIKGSDVEVDMDTRGVPM